MSKGAMEMNIRKLAALLIVLLFAVSLAGCGGGDKKPAAQTGGDSYIIKIANWYAPEHPQNVSLNKFKEIVESKTQGKIKVQIFPNSQLGSEETFIDSVKKGTVQMGVPGTMPSRDVPLIAIAEMPFLFTGWDHAQKVFTGPIGEEIAKDLISKAGVRNLAWTVNGMRVISSNKPLEKFEDLKGLRLRVPNVPYYLEMVKGFGGNPTPMALTELFNALEQKVVDGQDNPYPTVRSAKFYEVQKYMLDTKHMFSPNLWIINEKFFQSLSKDFQQVVTDAAKEAAKFNWEISVKKDAEDMKWLQENGVKIIIPDAKFRQQLLESQKACWEWYYVKYPGSKELAEKIRAVK